MQKVLVTGSSGSIGTALCEALLVGGYDVTGADIKANEWNEELNKKTLRVDLTDKDATNATLPKDAEVIIHLAAHSRVWDLVENPSLGIENITMFANVLEFARTHNIQKVIFSSSREVYGALVKDSYEEGDASIDNCENPYAMSKLAGEAMLRGYKTSFGIDSVILRFGNVYGRYDILNRVIPLFIAHVKTGKPIGIFGKDKILDFVFVDDATNGIICALQQFDAVKNSAYNIASGVGTNLKDLAEEIQKVMGATTPISTEDNRTGEVMRYIGNIDKAKRVLGYEPKIGLSEGLKRAVAWYSDFYDKHPERMPKLGN